MVSFFSLFCCGFQEKKQPNWKNYLIWIVDWVREHNFPDKVNTLIIFLSTVVMEMTFWTDPSRNYMLKVNKNNRTRLNMFKVNIPYSSVSIANFEQVNSGLEDNFCFNSDCRNSFNCKLKKLINEQIYPLDTSKMEKY